MQRAMLFICLVCTAMFSTEVGAAPGVVTTVARGILGGLSDFVHGVRSSYGTEGDFAKKNGFDYDHVYNGLLQYQVVNAYASKNIMETLQHLREEGARDAHYMLLGGFVLLVQITGVIVLLYRKYRQN